VWGSKRIELEASMIVPHTVDCGAGLEVGEGDDEGDWASDEPASSRS
jgi:hypothetical protein